MSSFETRDFLDRACKKMMSGRDLIRFAHRNNKNAGQLFQIITTQARFPDLTSKKLALDAAIGLQAYITENGIRDFGLDLMNGKDNGLRLQKSLQRFIEDQKKTTFHLAGEEIRAGNFDIFSSRTTIVNVISELAVSSEQSERELALEAAVVFVKALKKAQKTPTERDQLLGEARIKHVEKIIQDIKNARAPVVTRNPAFRPGISVRQAKVNILFLEKFLENKLSPASALFKAITWASRQDDIELKKQALQCAERCLSKFSETVPLDVQEKLSTLSKNLRAEISVLGGLDAGAPAGPGSGAGAAAGSGDGKPATRAQVSSPFKDAGTGVIVVHNPLFGRLPKDPEAGC